MADGSNINTEDVAAAVDIAAAPEAKSKPAREAIGKAWRKVWSKPPKIWGIKDVVGISDRAVGKVTWIAAAVALPAMLVNLFMVGFYALGVSVNAPLLATHGHDGEWWAIAVNFVITFGQVLVACMLQLGTDFGLLFAAGLAIFGFRITPSLALVLWAFCAFNTISMKHDIYHSIKEGRIAELREAEKPNIEQSQSIAWMQAYADNDKDGQPDRPIPPTNDANNAAIEAATERINDLRELRPELIATRDEEKASGRGPEYKTAVAALDQLDANVATERAAIAAARASIAERAEFDRHAGVVKSWEDRPPITESNIGYDNQWSIHLRVWGMSLLSLISILVAFATDKANEDKQKEEVEKAKKSEAAKKGVQTKKARGKYADYEDVTEGAPINAPQLSATMLEPVAEPAQTKTRRWFGKSTHPDASGDDHGARSNGYSPVVDAEIEEVEAELIRDGATEPQTDVIAPEPEPEPEPEQEPEAEDDADEPGNTDDDGAAVEPDAGADAGRDDEGEPGADEAGGDVRGVQAPGV